jgi:drug/metabolite transporter (DMT)-like permease
VGALPTGSTARFGIGLAAFSAATFGFGTTFATLAYQGGGNPLSVVLLRIAAFIVVVGLGLALLRRPLLLGRRPLRSTLWMAVTLAMVSLGYQGSVAFIPVSLAALIFYSYPLMVGVMAVLSGEDRMTAGKASALVAAFVGLSLALGPAFGALDWRGVALALVAALGMSLTVTFGGEATRDEDAVLMSVYTNIWMFIALAVFMMAAGGLALPVTPLGVAGAAGVCASYVVAYVCWYLALSLVAPVRLAGLYNIEPLVTLFAAWLVLGERLTGSQLLGAALVLASIVSLSRLKRASENEAAALHAD